MLREPAIAYDHDRLAAGTPPIRPASAYSLTESYAPGATQMPAPGVDQNYGAPGYGAPAYGAPAYGAPGYGAGGYSTDFDNGYGYGHGRPVSSLDPDESF